MLKVPSSFYICSGEQCRTMDERTINEFGIDGFTLMEVAGTRAADFIMATVESKSHGLFFCGKGNNAGDALVIARLLAEKGYTITICFVDGTSQLSPNTQKNLTLLQKLDGDVSYVEWNTDMSINSYHFIIDGMLGTGLKSKVRSPYSEIINWINTSEKTIFALDNPSGLNADNGQTMGVSINATYTLTFGALKTGFYLNDGLESTGEIILCELPFPNQYKKPDALLIDEDWVEKNLPIIKPREHKYAQGVLYIIAGSEGLTGAAILAAKSAWAAGVGAVVLITPKGLLPVYEKNLIQVIKKPVGTNQDCTFKTSHLDEIWGILSEKPGILLIGPGLGRSQETTLFTQKILAQYVGDVVIDADALYALSKLEKWARPKSSNWILTPHTGEFKQLFSGTKSDDFSRLNECKKQASKNEVTIMSKGYPGIIGTSEGEAYLTNYETHAFNRAGFGDVLAGKISAYYLKYKNPNLACLLALLDGKDKAEVFHSKHQDHLEPINLI